MSTRSLSRSLTRAATNANLAAAHSAVTIAARLPILGGYFLSPSAAALAEWNRACAEKVAATVEGSAAAVAEWQGLVLRSAFRTPTPAALADAGLKVLHKASQPGHRRVKANAQRLTKPKAKKA